VALADLARLLPTLLAASAADCTLHLLEAQLLGTPTALVRCGVEAGPGGRAAAPWAVRALAARRAVELLVGTDRRRRGAAVRP
jgi:hypothetical protein